MNEFILIKHNNGQNNMHKIEDIYHCRIFSKKDDLGCIIYEAIVTFRGYIYCSIYKGQSLEEANHVVEQLYNSISSIQPILKWNDPVEE